MRCVLALFCCLFLVGCAGQEDLKSANQLLKEERYAEALVSFNRSLEANPNQPGLYLKRGLCHHKLGENEQALADYKEAVRRSPRREHAYVSL